MSIYTTEAILLGWHTSDGPQGHWVKFKLPLAITDGHPFALFNKGPEHGQRFRMTFEAIGNDELPTGHAIVGSAPSPSLADAADSPAAAPLPRCNRLKCGIHRVLMEPTREIFACTEPDCDRSFHALSNSGDAKAAKPKKHWDELKPSQQAGMVCGKPEFIAWTGGVTEADATFFVRDACHVKSRADLDTNPEAAKRWRELHSMFTADTQYGDRR